MALEPLRKSIAGKRPYFNMQPVYAPFVCVCVFVYVCVRSIDYDGLRVLCFVDSWTKSVWYDPVEADIAIQQQTPMES